MHVEVTPMMIEALNHANNAIKFLISDTVRELETSTLEGQAKVIVERSLANYKYSSSIILSIIDEYNQECKNEVF